MHNHQPENYRCPLCYVVEGKEEENFPYTRQADIIYKDESITAFIASHWWPRNKGHVLIVPNQHVENLYDISENLLNSIHSFSKKVALALKETYACDGISVRQHNEPAGDQDVWHYHLHVFPRYENDFLYVSNEEKALSIPEDRLPFAEKLRNYFAK